MLWQRRGRGRILVSCDSEGSGKIRCLWAGSPHKSIALATYGVLKVCVCRVLFVGEVNHHDHPPSRALRLSKGGGPGTDGPAAEFLLSKRNCAHVTGVRRPASNQPKPRATYPPLQIGLGWINENYDDLNHACMVCTMYLWHMVLSNGREGTHGGQRVSSSFLLHHFSLHILLGFLSSFYFLFLDEVIVYDCRSIE